MRGLSLLGSRVALLALVVAIAIVAVALPRAALAEKRLHIVFACYHYTGHVVPLMALAKEVATKHRNARVSFATIDFAKDLVKRELSRYGIEFISMGRPPWTFQEESKMIAEIPEKGLEAFYTMQHIGGTMERISTEALIQRFSAEKPDFMVIDPMASGPINAADKFSIPYMYLHTSGLPMVDTWNSFFVKAPVSVAPILGPANLGKLSVHSVIDRIKVKCTQFFMDVMTIFVFQANRNRLRASFDIPPVRGMFRSSDIPKPVLLASAWGLSPAMTVPPYVQLVGAIFDPSLSPAAGASPDLIRWLDTADRPVVYVSTGTIARLSSAQVLALAKAMNSLTDYKFLWSIKKDKYDIELPAMEQHVRIEDFVPQAKVLEHKNTQVFLSHCGQNSMLEAISTGTPILALPLFGDQFHNSNMLEDNGAAIILDSANITTSAIADALFALTHHEIYSNNMGLLQGLLDIAGGKERAGDWVWLTARHGYEHLVPKELTVSWFLYHELDIPLNVLLILGIVLGAVYGVYRLIKRCICGCFRRREKTE